MSHFLSDPFRAVLSTVSSFIFGHRPDDSQSAINSSRKHGREEGSSDSVGDSNRRTNPDAAPAVITPSPPAKKRRRRFRSRKNKKHKNSNMVLSASDSCNTLVDLQGPEGNGTLKQVSSHLPLDQQVAREEEEAAAKRFRETRILLPADEYYYDCEEEDDEEEGAYCGGGGAASNNDNNSAHAEPRRLYLPAAATVADADDESDDSSESEELGRYLAAVPSVVESADALLSAPAIRLTSRNCADIRVLNVLQGEIGHCIPSQADLIVSDKATTCHIVALRSTAVGAESEEESATVVSLAHIDKAGYEDDLRGAVQVHKNHHRSVAVAARRSREEDSVDEEKKAEDELQDAASPRIEVDVHIVGGYSDPDGSSSSITSSLLVTLASLADEEYDQGVSFTLRTCAVGRLNDDSHHGGPVGRGLAMNVTTGQVFLASVDRTVAGPMIEARSARLWSRIKSPKQGHSLSTVHSLPIALGTCNGGNLLTVEAFKYEAFPEIAPILRLPDNVLLQYTSTSPDVEEDGFCDDVRSTLRFIRDSRATDVFGPSCDEDVAWRRCSDRVNRWEAVVRL